ncbi:cyclic nucleotide-binding domain-containing protein [Thalassoglobus sp. JC818]|uniref:cyclic nucleotide-binding domain-containing protein n=1 Tax=Thalassoglobus sp. JC818 TaxID=3232136 RepID=UPI00345993C9
MPQVHASSRPKRWDHPFCNELSGAGGIDPSCILRILQFEPFCNMDEAGFRKSLSLRDILSNDTRIQRYEPGDLVVRSGDWGNSAFFVLSGQLRAEIERPGRSLPPETLGRKQPVHKTFLSSIARLWNKPEYGDSPSPEVQISSRQHGSQTRTFIQDLPTVLDEYRTSILSPGQWFGELSALGRTPRTTTVFAEEPAKLLEIRWQGLRDLMRFDKNAAVKTQIEDAFREHGLNEFLRNNPMFHDLDENELEALATQVEFRTYGEYDSPKPFKELAREGYENNFETEALIFEEGHYPNQALIVRSGLARMTVRHYHGHRTIGYLTAGQSFGLEEIVEGAGRELAVPYRSSLRAISFLSAVLIPTNAVERIVSQRPSEKNLKCTTSSGKLDKCSKSNGVPENLINFFVKNHYVQGTATMVIDLDRCVRCDDCVRACAATHDDVPRFVRHGPIYQNYMMANACLHCLDPVCMVECPTGAIHRHLENGHIVINEETCIGCAQCANNCPFDAIRMVPLTDQSGRVIVDQKSSSPLKQATKCDLCADQSGGPACQAACSHDALYRVEMSDFRQLEKRFKQ